MAVTEERERSKGIVYVLKGNEGNLPGQIAPSRDQGHLRPKNVFRINQNIPPAD
jgi:hypothetical protein